MILALIVGHSKEKQGANNKAFAMSEFELNNKFAQQLKKSLDEVAIGLDVLIIYRETYKELPQKVNFLRPDFIISLHCNAFNTKASGSEVLFHQNSTLGKMLATALQHEIVTCLRLPDRGIKPITAKNRGGYLLEKTIAPCVITEPFFIDNDNDLSIATRQFDRLVAAYRKAISLYCKALMQ